jgi:hypothetical protein
MGKCAITWEDGSQCNLPSDFTKSTGMRQQAFVVKDGDVAVELDTLADWCLASKAC